MFIRMTRTQGDSGDWFVVLDSRPGIGWVNNSTCYHIKPAMLAEGR